MLGIFPGISMPPEMIKLISRKPGCAWKCPRDFNGGQRGIVQNGRKHIDKIQRIFGQMGDSLHGQRFKAVPSNTSA